MSIHDISGNLKFSKNLLQPRFLPYETPKSIILKHSLSGYFKKPPQENEKSELKNLWQNFTSKVNQLSKCSKNPVINDYFPYKNIYIKKPHKIKDSNIQLSTEDFSQSIFCEDSSKPSSKFNASKIMKPLKNLNKTQDAREKQYSIKQKLAQTRKILYTEKRLKIQMNNLIMIPINLETDKHNYAKTINFE